MTVVIASENVITKVPPDIRWERFANINTWIFDLDDTLYARSTGLHQQLKNRVVGFIAALMKLDHAQAEAVHIEYYERYGATLQGLVELHGVAPETFLDFVHAIDLSPLHSDAQLRRALSSLPGRRVIFTNSCRSHAVAVLDALNLSDLFDAIYSIEDCDFVGKPQRSAYASFLAAHAIDPTASAMFDDRVGNLTVPHDLGMRTVLVADAAKDRAAFTMSHVDTIIPELAAFLSQLVLNVGSSSKYFG
jgi:putative hydrolase of the HAD superfamily